jgi:magnesium transporter
VQTIITTQFIERLEVLIEARDEAQILELIGDLHPVDLAEVFHEITPIQSKYLYTLIDEEKAAEMVAFLDEDVREKFLDQLTSKEIAENFVENLDSDDAADIIGELSQERQREVLSEIDDIEIASDIVDLLKYDEDTAGGLMAKELIQVNVNWSREKVIDEIRLQAHEVENVYTVYVVNDEDVLLGILPLKKLLIEPETVRIEDMYQDKIHRVEVNQSAEEVATIMKKYDLVVLPVVDEIGRLVGRITIDDVVDVIQEEAEKDYQLMSGLSGNVESDDSVWLITRARIPWLLVGLLGGVVVSQVIGVYENEIRIHPEMAYFIPLIAAMGGNAGVQSSAIIVQGLANNSLRLGDAWFKFFKELSVGLINGFICSLAIMIYNVMFGNPSELSITVSVAMLTVIVVASILGTFIPLTLNRFKIDPALATGPFITTMNDITGMFIYFLIGRLMYGIL